VSLILGTKVQYGGLNNLMKTNEIDKITTLNWGIFSGIRLGI
jgi:hypothetical protein